MKFGGSSVESASAIRRVAAIIKDHRSRNPVVVVSAMGKTTSRLLELAQEAARGHVYFVSKQLAELQDYHFDEAAECVSGEPLERLESSLKRHFRDLHTLVSSLAEEGRELTPAISDEIAAYGERMSSEIMAAALESAGVSAVHVDARRVILTDDRHTQATPLYWETYARLRRLPELYSGRVAVMGGFIGSTERGATTTLGRGGSDLSASLVGAGISAEEIQIWTDVDGMLTSDPRICGEFYRLRSISYEEATEMARAGAKVLHPDSVMPAIRQHIPIVIRNSRNPGNEGTRIGPGAAGSGLVKSIACRENRMVLEIRAEGTRALEPEALAQLSDGQGTSPEWIGRQGNAVFVAVRGSAKPDPARTPFEGCVEARIHPCSAILTLAGDRVANAPGLCARVRNAMKQIPAMVLSAPQSEHAIVVVVPQDQLRESAALLHREFFARPDPSLFAPCRAEIDDRKENPQAMDHRAPAYASRKLRLVMELGR
ncbi:MAG TPA: aspartate kinase [Bryobacteraceae bacterium]|nr:aspartate kinase [Bryobacteraceae bacterium]